MIVCPNCLYQNPNGRQHCEACCAKLPNAVSCPQCGQSCLVDAFFCGCCGFVLAPVDTAPPPLEDSASSTLTPVTTASGQSTTIPPTPELSLKVVPENNPRNCRETLIMDNIVLSDIPKLEIPQVAYLYHWQSKSKLHLNGEQSVFKLGKRSKKSTPDINLGHLSHSEVISRHHANIFRKDNRFYIEDVGSANGTYLNNQRISCGDKHPLQAGDKISLGRGNLVTLIFELS